MVEARGGTGSVGRSDLAGLTRQGGHVAPGGDGADDMIAAVGDIDGAVGGDRDAGRIVETRGVRRSIGTTQLARQARHGADLILRAGEDRQQECDQDWEVCAHVSGFETAATDQAVVRRRG